MKFMNVIRKFTGRNDMVKFREGMLNEAEELLGAGKMEEYEAKISDIEQFDNEYAEYIEKQANIAALRNTQTDVPMSNIATESLAMPMTAREDNEMQYRNAFMNFVLTGEIIPPELRNADAYTTTSDVTAVIPNTVLNRIVELIETTGHILNKVTRTFYKGGVTVPTSAAKPVATWTSERGTVEKQKKTTGSITFAYHKLKCVIAISMTVENVTLEVFERTIANNIAEAMVKALEKAIIAGTGEGQPKGILKENAPTKQNIDIAATANITYKDLCSAEGALPAGYEQAEWAMTKKTYFNEIVAMTDANGQPIARTNIGINGKPTYVILGRPVNFINEEDMPTYTANVSTDTVFAFMFDFKDYILNTNMNVTVSHYEDHETDDKMTKAVMLADGKVVARHSMVTMTKKKAAS